MSKITWHPKGMLASTDANSLTSVGIHINLATIHPYAIFYENQGTTLAYL